MSRAKTLDGAYKSIIIIAIVTAVLILAGTIVMPILFSGMVAILILPLAEFFEKAKIPRGLAAFLSVIIVSIFLLGLLFAMLIQSQEILKNVPELVQQKTWEINFDHHSFNSETIYSFLEEHAEAIEENLEALREGFISTIKQGLIGLKDTLLFIILVPIYVFFMLLCRTNVYNFVNAYTKKKSENSDTEIIKEVKGSLYQYLKGLSLIMTISGVLTFLGLYIIGIPYALFLGVLTAILTPIPYIGVFISATIPVTLALLTKDSWWVAAGVILVFSIVQFLEAYVFTPRIMGQSVNINPLIIVIGLIVFGSITGILGMILTVPLLAITNVIINYYPHLKPWKYLFEDHRVS